MIQKNCNIMEFVYIFTLLHVQNLKINAASSRELTPERLDSELSYFSNSLAVSFAVVE